MVIEILVNVVKLTLVIMIVITNISATAITYGLSCYDTSDSTTIHSIILITVLFIVVYYSKKFL